METITLKDQDLVYREEGEESLLFDPATGSIKIMNPTANFIWKKIKTTSQRLQVLEALKEEFLDTDFETLQKDLEAFIESLKSLNLV